MCVPNNVNNNNSYSTGILIIRDNFIQRKKKTINKAEYLVIILDKVLRYNFNFSSYKIHQN